ncbi:MAG: hypothetical protein GTN40_00665 [Candidatus Aenigmarchaeota archaeon]|nr:hypothetical protein [Candidatus Aenigmarchaeota archaeon]
MQFKKLAAIAGSALMTGMSLMSPVLASTVTELGKISDMITVTDSTVSFPLFVIGARAAPADVAGAVDVAVNMAANAKTTTDVTTTIAGESVTGGAKIETSGIFLTPYTNPQNVKGIITTSDIPSLLGTKTYSSASGGAYQYKQYLYLLGETDLGSNGAQIKFERPTTENTPRISFKVPASYPLYTYKLTFSTPVSLSGVTSNTLLQAVIQGTTISILGKDFVISDATYGSSTDTISTMTLLGGKNLVTVETGAPQTITSEGKDYTVTLTGVAAQTIGTSTYYSAIGDVNGESFTLKAGETKTLSDGTQIAAIKVFQGKTGAADYATLAIGADKVKVSSAGTVTKGTSVVSELVSGMTSSVSGGWSVFSLTYTPTLDKWLSAGDKVADSFASTFDIKFNSIIPDFTDAANRQSITFNPSGYNMFLKYKNAADAEEQMFSVYSSDGVTWRWASAPVTASGTENDWRDVVFDEGANISAVDQDFFVIQKGGFSHTMVFTAYTAATGEFTFTDESGNSITATGNQTSNGAIANLIVDGNIYRVYLISNTSKTINVDLNGDGYIAGTAYTDFTTPGPLGREYSFLAPKLITTGQGGLYFYTNYSSGAMTAGTWIYPQLGFAGIRLVRNADNTTTVATYGPTAGTWTNETAIGEPVEDGAYGSGTFAKNHIDYVVRVGRTSAAMNYTVKLGTSTSAWYDGTGFILVEEAQQGGQTHNWLYLPVSWDSTNNKVSIATSLYSDDSAYADVPLLGTSTQYKGMTTYGTLSDHLTSNLGGSATISYPDVFTYGNVYVLTPTGVITSGGVGGVITTDVVLPITSDVVKLDTEVTSSDKSNYDLVIVGGPCINKLAAEVMGHTDYTCGAASGIPENAGLIKLVADKFATGKTALLIAGWEAGDTDLAARIVQTGFPGATDTQKAGAEVTVTGTVASPSYS